MEQFKQNKKNKNKIEKYSSIEEDIQIPVAKSINKNPVTNTKKETDLNIGDVNRDIMKQREKNDDRLLEKHPNILFSQQYGKYLENEVKTMGHGKRVKGLNIIEANGKVSNGHLAEQDFLNDVHISRYQRVLCLKDKSPDQKDRVFEDLVEYYGDDEFQKKGECKLGSFSRNFLLNQIQKNNPEVKIEHINFFTAVGTTLDFNFGVDGWIEITDSEGLINKVYFDMKTGGYDRRRHVNAYADVILQVEEKVGKIDPKTQVNLKNISFFLKLVELQYIKKRNEEKIKKEIK